MTQFLDNIHHQTDKTNLSKKNLYVQRYLKIMLIIMSYKDNKQEPTGSKNAI